MLGLITNILDILEKGGKASKVIAKWLQNRSIDPLQGDFSTGMGVANRIIALFNAHDVKLTQIYRLLGECHPQITPDLNAKKLQRVLNGQLISDVGQLFGVRREWLEGEAGRIYAPLYHHKNLPEFVSFSRELKSKHPDRFCILSVYKPFKTSSDLYQDAPEIALVFSAPIAEIDQRIIYRHYPVYGPFPWDHPSARFHLYAFFNFSYSTQTVHLKGYEVENKAIARISDGKAIPHHKIKTYGIWHPEDYSYPQGQYNGRVKIEDWKAFLDYFDNPDLRKHLSIDFSKR